MNSLASSMPQCQKQPISERIERHVSIVPITGCWLWMGTINRDGYGKLLVRDAGSVTDSLAHRVVYKHYVGAIPHGLTLDHLCRNKWCVNPAHMEAVTGRENTLRGNGPSAQAARRDRCVRGHIYTAENTYIAPPGNKRSRRCRKCQREAVRAYKLRKRSRA